MIGEAFNSQIVSPQLIYSIVESVIGQISVQNQSPVQPRFKNKYITDLLHGRINDEDTILYQAKALGIDLNPPRAVILVNAADYITQDLPSDPQVAKFNQQQRTQEIISSIVNFFHLPNDTICADLGNGKICVLKASDTKNLDLWAEQGDVVKRADCAWANLKALRRAADALRLRLQQDTCCSTTIGIGRYYPGVEGIARSYEDANAALSLGSRLQGVDRVHCLAELGVVAFVGIADETTKVELAQYLLSPLSQEPDLLVTIDTFFSENCCCSSTAKRLYIHRNTLTYRLDKIASLTGLDPRRFDDAVQIRLSLLLRTLNSAKNETNP